jgi:hypothetical protein
MALAHRANTIASATGSMVFLTHVSFLRSRNAKTINKEKEVSLTDASMRQLRKLYIQ